VTRAQSTLAIALGVVVLGVIYYVWTRGAGAIARGAVNLANNTIGGAVVGLGDAIGIPETNMTECEQLLAAGRYWDASFKCPAGTLVKGFFGDVPSSPPSSPTELADAPTL
jgi:hypothetical protein